MFETTNWFDKCLCLHRFRGPSLAVHTAKGPRFSRRGAPDVEKRSGSPRAVERRDSAD